MTTLRVYAHHGEPPAGFLTATQPALPSMPDDVQPLAEYWCELVSQSYVDSPPAYDGPGYGQMSAVAPDEWRFDLGYDMTAADFVLTGVCVLQVGATANAGYQFQLISPRGKRISMPLGIVPEPMAPMPEWGNPESPYTGLQSCWDLTEQVDNARGLWRLQVFSSSSSGVPVEAAWVNGISCVQLGEDPEAGFLALEFTGVEVEPTTTTTTTTTTTPEPTTTTTTTTPEPTTTTTTTTPEPTTTTTTTTTTPEPTTTTTTTTPEPTTTTTTTTPEPTTTTTTTTTTTSTTTTTTTTPAPTTTTTTTTTTSPPLWDQLGFFGKLFLLVALGITLAAAVSFFVWACSGYISLGLFALAVSLAAAAAFLLPAWTLLFRTGRTMDLLSMWFAVLSAGTPLLAAFFAIIGELNCAAGALIASGLFGALLSVLTLARRIQLRRKIKAGLRHDR